MKRRLWLALAALGGAALAPIGAQAQNQDATSSVRLYRGGELASGQQSMKVEKGVRVYRPAAPAPAMQLAGGEPLKSAPAPAVKVVVVHHYHSKIRHLRTQGFYSGHPGKSRRYTQGFYSGPVDKGRRR